MVAKVRVKAGVKARAKGNVIGQRRARAVAKSAPVLLLASLLLVHRHRVPVDMAAKQCLHQTKKS